MWFGHLFKVFRSISLDFTGYVSTLMLVNLFVEKQDMFLATLPDVENEIICNKNILFAKIT